MENYLVCFNPETISYITFYNCIRNSDRTRLCSDYPHYQIFAYTKNRILNFLQDPVSYECINKLQEIINKDSNIITLSIVRRKFSYNEFIELLKIIESTTIQRLEFRDLLIDAPFEKILNDLGKMIVRDNHLLSVEFNYLRPVNGDNWHYYQDLVRETFNDFVLNNFSLTECNFNGIYFFESIKRKTELKDSILKIMENSSFIDFTAIRNIKLFQSLSSLGQENLATNLKFNYDSLPSSDNILTKIKNYIAKNFPIYSVIYHPNSVHDKDSYEDQETTVTLSTLPLELQEEIFKSIELSSIIHSTQHVGTNEKAHLIGEITPNISEF